MPPFYSYEALAQISSETTLVKQGPELPINFGSVLTLQLFIKQQECILVQS